MDSEPTFEQRRAIQDEQQFHDALAAVDFLLRLHGGDEAAALEMAQAEDARRAAMIGSDGGFWREVVRVLRASIDNPRPFDAIPANAGQRN